jgi:predicted O-methyltransferase YrrM
MNSFPEFLRNVARAGLEETVVPIVACSGLAGRQWSTPLALVFIDGGHSFEAALQDYRSWAPHLVAGGILAIHDIFPDPSQGGQAPHEIAKMAQASGFFERVGLVNTLGLFRRLGSG